MAPALLGDWRLILLFSDEAAAKPFRAPSKRWDAQAISGFGIEIEVVDLPAELRGKVQAAQVRQYR